MNTECCTYGIWKFPDFASQTLQKKLSLKGQRDTWVSHKKNARKDPIYADGWGTIFFRERCFCGKEKGKFTIKSLRGDVMRFKSAQKHVLVCQGFWQVKTGEKLELFDRILTYHEEASIRWQVWNFYFLPGYEKACKKVLSKAETKPHSTSCLRARLRESSSFGQTRARAERKRKSLANFPRGERKRKVRIR